MTRPHLGGTVRQLASLRPVLKPRAMLGYVVGDKASYLQVMIQIGEILTELANELSYEVCRLDLFRETLNPPVLANRILAREERLRPCQRPQPVRPWPLLSIPLPSARGRHPQRPGEVHAGLHAGRA